uniref:C-type lectin domain-containing protein n=1 Tax=Salarias fasciatus TaxID=181472 RepID=A0A672J820_SALFA
TFSVEQPVMTVVCLSVTELRCPGNDWYEFGEFCYKPFSERKTWGAARDDCFYRGGDLVSIHSQEEEEFLSTYSKGTSKWIGYSWSDGTPLSHTNWADGEPNNHEGREECVEMVSSTNGTYSWWNDLNCDSVISFPSIPEKLGIHKNICGILICQLKQLEISQIKSGHTLDLPSFKASRAAAE